MDFKIIRTDRKSVQIRVGGDLTVEVRAPRWTLKKDIIELVEKNSGWIEKRKREILAQKTLSGEEIEDLRLRGRKYIPERVSFFSQIMELVPLSVKITSAKTRFGSCSAGNRLCFSLYLMSYPAEAIDYVVVHELAHIAHKNHGREFYDLVGSILPDYRNRRKLLKLSEENQST